MRVQCGELKCNVAQYSAVQCSSVLSGLADLASAPCPMTVILVGCCEASWPLYIRIIAHLNEAQNHKIVLFCPGHPGAGPADTPPAGK